MRNSDLNGLLDEDDYLFARPQTVDEVWIDDTAEYWEQAWPYMQRAMRWHGYASTERQRTTVEEWLDMKAATDGFVVTHDDRLESYQWKVSHNLAHRSFTVRNSVKTPWHRTEWERLHDRGAPDWFIKAYIDPATLELVEFAIVETDVLVAAIDTGLARLQDANGSSYWVKDWAELDGCKILGPAVTTGVVVP